MAASTVAAFERTGTGWSDTTPRMAPLGAGYRLTGTGWPSRSKHVRGYFEGAEDADAAKRRAPRRYRRTPKAGTVTEWTYTKANGEQVHVELAGGASRDPTAEAACAYVEAGVSAPSPERRCNPLPDNPQPTPPRQPRKRHPDGPLGRPALDPSVHRRARRIAQSVADWAVSQDDVTAELLLLLTEHPERMKDAPTEAERHVSLLEHRVQQALYLAKAKATPVISIGASSVDPRRQLWTPAGGRGALTDRMADALRAYETGARMGKSEHKAAQDARDKLAAYMATWRTPLEGYRLPRVYSEEWRSTDRRPVNIRHADAGPLRSYRMTTAEVHRLRLAIAGSVGVPASSRRH